MFTETHYVSAVFRGLRTGSTVGGHPCSLSSTEAGVLTMPYFFLTCFWEPHLMRRFHTVHLPPLGLGQGAPCLSDVEPPTFQEADAEACAGHACANASKTQPRLHALCFCLLVGHPCPAFLGLRLPRALYERWTRRAHAPRTRQSRLRARTLPATLAVSARSAPRSVLLSCRRSSHRLEKIPVLCLPCRCQRPFIC